MQNQPNTTHIGEASKQFLTYVRTKMFYQQRLRTEDGVSPVHISTKEIELNFFQYPRFNRKTELKRLVDNGELEVSSKVRLKGFACFYYKALRAGAIDLSLLASSSDELDELALKMKETLDLVTLLPQAPSTPYFDAFLKNNHLFPDLFFIRDHFSGRIHTPITNFHRTHRPNILIGGQPTSSLDVTTMQPLLLGKILKDQVGDNEFTTWIENGEDIYQMLQKKANLSTRDQGKKRFFEILFAKPNNALETMFGASNWIKWVNEYKSKPEVNNPRTIEKEHSNLAWLLQTTEVILMRKIWKDLVEANIPFLSVHDEIIVRRSDVARAESIMKTVLNSEFKFYKINSDKK